MGLQNPPPTPPSARHVDVTSQCFTIPKDLFSIKTDIFSIWLYGKTWQNKSELLYSGYGPGENKSLRLSSWCEILFPLNQTFRLRVRESGGVFALANVAVIPGCTRSWKGPAQGKECRGSWHFSQCHPRAIWGPMTCRLQGTAWPDRTEYPGETQAGASQKFPGCSEVH